MTISDDNIAVIRIKRDNSLGFHYFLIFMAAKTINVNDRVRRSDKTGPIGTVKQVRTEVTAASVEAKEKKMYYVLWDNGTLSCLGGDGLEVV